MQGKKQFEEKLFTTVQLSKRISASNYYRKVKQQIKFDFIYPKTKLLYSKRGKESLDPVVFFKLCLIRKHENWSSDVKLMNWVKIRLDLLYFLDYNLDDKLPASATISHTRSHFPPALFNEIFEQIESMIAEKEIQ